MTPRRRKPITVDVNDLEVDEPATEQEQEALVEPKTRGFRNKDLPRPRKLTNIPRGRY